MCTSTHIIIHNIPKYLSTFSYSLGESSISEVTTTPDECTVPMRWLDAEQSISPNTQMSCSHMPYSLATQPPSPFISPYATTAHKTLVLCIMCMLNKNMGKGVQEPCRGVIASLTHLSNTLSTSMTTCLPLTANHCQVIKAC